MEMRLASRDDLAMVRHITQTTIQVVYPRYYPAGAVQFFCDHHSDQRILDDIDAGKVFLLTDGAGDVGTVTVSGNEINRLFVLPEHQRKGYGRALLDFAEARVGSQHDVARLDVSLPAKAIYLKRGYREVEYHVIETDNGDFLCYDVMEKRL